MHIAAKVPDGGPEFYPSCTQLNVEGDGDGRPDTFVTFPDVYQNDGSLYADVFGLNEDTYKFPAGPIANIVSGGKSKRGWSKAANVVPVNQPLNYFSWRNLRGPSH